MMEAKMMIAGNFDEFVEKVTQAERKALNTPFGAGNNRKAAGNETGRKSEHDAGRMAGHKKSVLNFPFCNVCERNARSYGRTCAALLGRTASQRSIIQHGRRCCRPERMVIIYGKIL